MHLDGLADTADGFLSSRPRERILEIMKDSHVGVMGMMVIVVVLLLKFAALSSVDPKDLWRVVLLMPLAGRCSVVVQMAVLSYVREKGLGRLFHLARPRWAVIEAVAVLCAAGWCVLGMRGLGAGALGMVVSLAFAGYCYRKIGGATGDTYGASCEIVEMVPALALTIWPLSA
jgi:adenosylcobinamide-GDP ribazoletransferase